MIVEDVDYIRQIQGVCEDGSTLVISLTVDTIKKLN